MCKCGCDTCETKPITMMLNEVIAPRAILSEGLKYHLDNKKPITEQLYRAGSPLILIYGLKLEHYTQEV
jgi:hypothetical protein